MFHLQPCDRGLQVLDLPFKLGGVLLLTAAMTGYSLGSGRWHDGDVPIDAARTERLVASSSPTSPTQRILGRLGYLDFVEVDNAIHHGTPRMGKWNLVGAAPVCVLLSALRVSLSRENRDDVDY